MDRIINDYVRKDKKETLGNSDTAEYNAKITAVNDMYKYLYEKGILKQESFEYRDCKDTCYFAVDADTLIRYREEMLNSGIINAEIAVKSIFDEEYAPCAYCGSVSISWPMIDYRGSLVIRKAWNCVGCRVFNDEAVSVIQQVKEEKGIVEAVKKEWSMFVWEE